MTVEADQGWAAWVGLDDDDDEPSPEPSSTPNDAELVLLSAKGTSVLLPLGPGNISPSGGIARYTEIEVPHETSITQYEGVAPWQMEVPILLDAWIDRANATQIRNKLNTIIGLAQPVSKKPPKVRCYGLLVPRHLNGAVWRINDIDWGEAVYDEADGSLLRQALSLKLLEANDGDLLNIKKKKRKKGKKGKGKKGKGGKGTRWYTIKKGDTLQKIAAKFYNDPHKWQKIAKANDIKKPRNLQVGKRIKIP